MWEGGMGRGDKAAESVEVILEKYGITFEGKALI